MDNIDIEGLTENEAEVIQQTLKILLIKEHQINVVKALVSKCPEIEETFSTIPDIANQGGFLINMYKRGVNLLCNQEHEEVYEIFQRHPKYNIKILHVEQANAAILNVLLAHIEEKNNSDQEEEEEEEKYPEIDSVKNCWVKLQNNFIILMTAAYESDKKKPSEAKLAKYRQRVFRSITMQDINDVTEAFAIMSETKEKSAATLARLLSCEKSILKVFHAHNINVASQAEVIFDMVAKALDQLSDIDNLIPWLRNLGVKHAEMGINPRTLALMKPILVSFFQECLGFNFTDSLKEAWIRIASFIIGMMMDGCRQGGDKGSTCSSIGDGDGDGGDYGAIPSISENDIKVTQETWEQVQKVLDIAVTSFYKDLISSKAEIRNLFNASDMESQSSKLLRAIGATITLLSNLDELTPILEELGRRHVYYNVMPRHFKYLKLAWFRMLKNALALKFTDDVNKSWDKVWRYITSIMKASLEDALLLYTPPDPEKVKLKILINHIDRIETQHMTYWADIWYAAFTNDNPSQSAAFGAEAYNEDMKNKSAKDIAENKLLDIRPSWNLTSLNGMDIKSIYKDNGDQWVKKYESSDASSKKDEWFTRGNILGTFSQAFDLHAFPIDTHVLRSKFALEIDESIATFDDDNLRIRLMPFKLDMMGGTDWDIFPPKIYTVRESAVQGGSASGKRYTHCVIEIPIARRWKHHVWDTFIPLFLIEIFAFAVYFTAVSPIAKRMGVVATLLLTLFTFKITVSESMPPTPYSTLMDYFFHGAKLLLVLHIIAQVLIVSFVETTGMENINEICGIAIFIVFLILNGLLIFKIHLLLKKYPSKQITSAISKISKSAMQSQKNTINQSMNQSMSRRDASESHIAMG